MGKSTKFKSGGEKPDWFDVQVALRAVADIHSAVTMVTILPVGTGATGGLRIVITSSWERLDGSPEVAAVITDKAWDGHDNDLLPAFVLGGIYQHDYDVGASYEQRRAFE